MWYVFGGIKTFLYHHFSYFNCNFDTSVSNFFESVLKGLPISGLLKYWGLAKQTGEKKRKSCSLLCVHTRSTCNIRVKKGLKPAKCFLAGLCSSLESPVWSTCCWKHPAIRPSCSAIEKIRVQWTLACKDWYSTLSSGKHLKTKICVW